MEKRVGYVCAYCGSNAVLMDAWAAWDTEKQDWGLHDTLTEAFCRECDLHRVPLDLGAGFDRVARSQRLVETGHRAETGRGHQQQSRFRACGQRLTAAAARGEDADDFAVRFPMSHERKATRARLPAG